MESNPAALQEFSSADEFFLQPQYETDISTPSAPETVDHVVTEKVEVFVFRDKSAASQPKSYTEEETTSEELSQIKEDLGFKV